MDLRQLACVVAVARSQSFTLAGEQLFMTQPAVSLQIRRLEAELGIRLFERTSRRVTVTPAGSALVTWAERMLADADAARQAMAEHAGGKQGRLRIAGWCSVNPELPELLADYSRTHPGVEVRIAEENSDRMLHLLRSGDLDVALPMMRPGLDLTDLETTTYLEEPFVLISRPGTALARKDIVDASEVASAPLVIFRQGSSVRLLVEKFFEERATEPRVALETAQLATARSFVSAGIGVAIVPRSVAERAGPPVAITQLDAPPRRISFIAWRRNASLPTAVTAFLSFAQNRLQQLYAR